MDVARKIEPVWNRCIYCGACAAPGTKLGDEHIIPLSFGGEWILKGASCKECEKVTSAFEKQTADHIVTPIREHLGLLGRKQNKPRSMMPVNLIRDQLQERHKVSPEDHPAVMYMYAFSSPSVFTDEPLSEDIWGRLVVNELTTDFSARAARLPGQINLVLRGPFHPLPFARTLAKIAHSYAMAKLGPNGFKPLLTDLILGRSPSYPNHFVGSAPKSSPKSSTRHHVSLQTMPRIDGRPFIVATIRLFGDCGMPVHSVVVGEPPNTPTPYSPTDVRPITSLRLSGILLPDGRIATELNTFYEIP